MDTAGNQPVDHRFRFVTSLGIIVPSGYDHAARIAAFRKAHAGEFADFNSDVSDEHFAEQATVRLESGRRIRCEVMQAVCGVSSDECLRYLKSRQALLLGAQGPTIVCEQGKEKLPKCRWLVSFDDRPSLWNDSKDERIPFLMVVASEVPVFGLCYFADGLAEGDCLLCFREG